MTSFSPTTSPPVSKLPETIPVSLADLGKLKLFVERLAEGYERIYLPDVDAIVMVDGLRVFYGECHRRRRLLLAEAHAMQEQIDRLVAKAVTEQAQGKVLRLERRRG